MEDFIKEYGALVLGGLGTLVVIGGFVAVLCSGVGDMIANYLTGII